VTIPGDVMLPTAFKAALASQRPVPSEEGVRIELNRPYGDACLSRTAQTPAWFTLRG
jgi:hypothetical protein